MLETIWIFIKDHIEWLAFWAFVIVYRKELVQSLFLQPIRGGNGITQNDELAKYVIICLLTFAIIVEAKDDRTYIDPQIVWALIVGVLGIAGVRQLSNISNPFKKEDDKAKQPDDHQGP